MILLICGIETESNKWTNKKNRQTKIHRHRQPCGGYQREAGWGGSKGKGGQIYGDRFEFGWWAHMQSTGDIG